MSQDTQLPDYVASATPNPKDKRAGWLTTTAATYAGVMLWFVFWSNVPNGGGLTSNPAAMLGNGLGFALLALVIAAAICYFMFYLVPGMLGMKTGLPLYIVGTSTYGVKGGFIMPGFLMGALQFGWLSVNAFAAGALFTTILGQPVIDLNAGTWSMTHAVLATLWAVIGAFIGLKGIKYVGMIASYMPIIPLVVILLLIAKTIGGIGSFDKDKMLAPPAPIAVVAQEIQAASEELAAVVPEEFQAEVAAISEVVADEVADVAAALPVSEKQTPLGAFAILAIMCANVVGFFATAGAAGCDFGSGNKDAKAVQMGGLVGVFLVTVFTGGAALIMIAGSQSMPGINPQNLNPTDGAWLGTVFGNASMTNVIMFLLCIAAFPSACFSSLIAANSFKATLPKVNPFVSCGLGTLVAVILAVSGLAGKAGAVFTVIGASFGPVCGAMVADYLLAGKKWAGPRSGFNPAGWISWVVGFIVGGLDLVAPIFVADYTPLIPCPPVSAFIVGFVLYWICAKAGMQSKSLDMPQRIDN